jgi:hypothetical protein
MKRGIKKINGKRKIENYRKKKKKEKIQLINNIENTSDNNKKKPIH